MAKLSFGFCYFSTPAATTVATDTPIKALGTTTAGALAEFTHVASNRLRCDVAISRTYIVMFTGSQTKSNNGADVSTMYLYKNGTTPIPGAETTRTITSATDHGAFAVSASVTLVDTDYVELWIENAAVQSTDLTIQAGCLSAVVVG
jgi:hypothetical protein